MNLGEQNKHCSFRTRLSGLKLFFGLSRTPHGLLDVATPAMAAMLQLGHFPPMPTILIGLVTAFAGYTAVYSLNDIVDVKVDKERLALKDRALKVFHVDEIVAEHPVAQGLIPFKKGLAWVIFWAVIALTGATILNPVCAMIFLVSACCEGLYCKLLRITHLKIIPSAIVKASGGLAGIYAVNPDPPLGFVAFMFLWLACWEVGGQNIPNDIIDMEDDIKVGARTTLTVLGLKESIFIMIVAVSMAAFAGVAIYFVAGSGVSLVYPFAAAILGYLTLLRPARHVYESPGVETATSLFNRASYMPLSFLILTVVSTLITV
ncbi:MAG: UbiA family prenyltransferase [Desulfomonilaceae bacterium]|jgi:4-hydroxybenzoate polyprenyltransferase